MPGQIERERQDARTAVELVGKVTCRGNSSGGTVIDLSDSGISFRLTFDIEATVGQSVSIESEELGQLSGIVQWARGDRIGVRLNMSSNTAAKIASYYKFFR